MSQATTRASSQGANTGQEPPPNKDLRGLMPYLRRYTRSIVLGLFMVVLMGIIGNLLPLAIGILTDTLSGSPAPFQHAAGTTAALSATPRLSVLSRAIPYYEPNSHRTLGIYCLVLVLCVAIKGLLSFEARWKLIGVSRDIEYDIRSDLLKRLLALEPEFYVRNRTGELMSRATNDLNSVRMVLGPGIMYSATTLVTMIMAILVMVTISPSLTLWVLVPAPVVAVAVWYFGKTIHELYEKIQAALATLT
ncbi:MAG TPA: ABC transporter transmembrane domain-containing protein, partial [Candidatus Acidoferrum sp.]|nr:ABC transporter transmembrane domain-containing protein [Candidatus Acidoferrum sp.]